MSTASTPTSPLTNNAHCESLSSGSATLLLDFAPLDSSTTATPTVARLYQGACTRVTAHHASQLENAYSVTQAKLQLGSYVVVLATYEMGAALHGLPAHTSASPLFEAYVFNCIEHLTAEARDTWLREQKTVAQVVTPSDAPASFLAPQALCSFDAYAAAFARIQQAIADGETYQVNFTFPLSVQSYGHPVDLYQRLTAHQPVAYGALLRLPAQTAGEVRWVLSRSPELFMQRQGRQLTVRPMKGTLPASDDATENATRAHTLTNDPKNRAENVMIVDMLRNDLGRIAECGSVQVSQLFTVEPYRTVLQMTSTIHATALAGLSLQALLKALFPCGSITGAPKHHTMRLIHSLETQARGLYTGALGWMDPPTLDGEALGDFCFSVPIRTLTLNAQGQGSLGVGGGIVQDSDVQQEWQECHLKARFLTQLPAQVGLIETFVGSTTGYSRLPQHLERLAASARALNLPWQAAQQQSLMSQLRVAQEQMTAGQNYRCRVQLNPTGEVQLTTATLNLLPTPSVKLFWAQQTPIGLAPTCSTDVLLQHKTTHRQHYDYAWQRAETQGGFDAIFINKRGEVTEGGRSTLWIQQGGVWLTPALSCGVLPGVMRAAVLANPIAYGLEGVVREAIITREQVLQADVVLVSNSLRGVLPAHF